MEITIVVDGKKIVFTSILTMAQVATNSNFSTPFFWWVEKLGGQIEYSEDSEYYGKVHFPDYSTAMFGREPNFYCYATVIPA